MGLIKMDKLPAKDKYKIAFIRPGGIAAPHIIDHLSEGFAALGHDVDVFDIFYRFQGASPGDMFDAYYQYLEKCVDNRVDLVIMYNMALFLPITPPPGSPLMDNFKFEKKYAAMFESATHLLAALGLPYLFYWCDSPEIRWPHMLSVKNCPRQWIAAWDMFYVDFLSTNGFRNLIHLPLASSERHFFPADKASVPDKFRCDVCFIGSPTQERADILSRLPSSVDFAIFGPEEWARHPQLSNKYRGPVSYPEEANLAYNGARIVLEITSDHVRSAVTQRPFDALCGGNLVLARKEPGLEQFFIPDKEIALFDGVNGAHDSIIKLLGDDSLAGDISRAGQARVLAEHTWKNRAGTLIDNIFA